MKNVFLAIITFGLAIAFAATGSATFTASPIPPKNAPSSVYWVTLAGIGTGVAQDTIGATYNNVYGPFPLSKDPSRPQAKYIRCYTRTGTLPATCTLSVEYQILPTTSLSDTGKANWVAFDSIKAAAGNSRSVFKIDSIPGVSIAFRLKCLANSSTAIIAKPIRILFGANASEEKTVN